MLWLLVISFLLKKRASNGRSDSPVYSSVLVISTKHWLFIVHSRFFLISHFVFSFP